ncbi:hypothetical protein [Streptomyces sp. NPDC088254]|uniref:hypothetical protein n=1 Tax=Streptomyces sp. NPDC088254 TaxID=3365847 RepID=UPI0038107345
MTCALPSFAGHGTDDSPLKVTDAAPVYPLESPTTATARLAEASTAAEIAVEPTWPEVSTRVNGHVGVVPERPPVAGGLPAAPTPVDGPRGDARFTLSALPSVAWLRGVDSSGSTSARTRPANSAGRPRLALLLVPVLILVLIRSSCDGA